MPFSTSTAQSYVSRQANNLPIQQPNNGRSIKRSLIECVNLRIQLNCCTMRSTDVDVGMSTCKILFLRVFHAPLFNC